MLEQLNSGTMMEDIGIPQLREFLTSEESKLFTPTLNRGLCELTLQAIYMAATGKAGKLAAVKDGAEYYRARQQALVERVMAKFDLDTGK